MEDVHTVPPTIPTTEIPEVTTILPAVVPENVATAIPDVGLQAADGGLGLMAGVAAVAETTLPPVEASTVAVPEKPVGFPYVHSHFHTHPHQFPQAYPSFGYTSKVNIDALPKPGAPGYGFPSYPVLRPPYSPYGLPHFHHQYPGYSPEAGYGNPFLHEATPDTKSAEKPESDDKLKASEAEKKPVEAGIQAADEGLGLKSGVAVVPEGSKVVSTVPEKPVGIPPPYSGFGPGIPAYSFPSYPVLRPSYSPYGRPHFHHQYPGGYGSTFPQESKSDEKPSADDKVNALETEKKPAEVPGEAAFGSSTVYASPRFRYLPRYPYANPTPYGY